jgi:nucleotide-binding universal stress UspA family protein
MKTILVATDYSQESDNALRYALDMARVADLKVVVLHAFYPLVSPPAAYDIPSLFPELEKEKVAELKQKVKDAKQFTTSARVLRFRSTMGTETIPTQAATTTKSGYHVVTEEKAYRQKDNLKIACVCKVGTPFEQIVNVAKAQQAELIVMGMQGGGAISQTLIGSTTVKVMRNSSIPVLGVPRHARFNGLNSVVFASELSKHPDHSMLQKLSDFVKTHHIKLQVLHLYGHHNHKAEYEKAGPSLDALDLDLYDTDFSVYFRQRETVAEGIEEFLLEKRADLLIVSPQRHNFFERLQNKSVTGKMTGRAYLPILALPATETQKEDARPKQQFRAMEYVIS